MLKARRYSSGRTQTKVCATVVAVIVFATGLLGGDEVKPRPKLPEAVQSTVDVARGTAPEIFADTIVRLVESGKIPQRELQVELLEDAFHAAGSASEPVRLIGIPGTPPDTREMYRGLAGTLGLDAISLQARILRDLLSVDREKARELFGHIAHPSLDPRPCADALVADIAPFYEIAAAIAQSAFSPAEKEHDAHMQFLIALLAGAKSPGELAAFAGAIENVTFTPQQWEVLLTVLSQKLEAIGADYRSFAVSFNSMEGAISRLAEFARANRLEADGLLSGLRKYTVAQMKAPRCAPDISISVRDTPLIQPPLTANETDPGQRWGSIQAHAYFDSGDAKAIWKALEPVSPGPNAPSGVPCPPDSCVLQASARGVIQHNYPVLADVMKQFELWSPSGSEADVLHQKATVLVAALQVADEEEEALRRTGHPLVVNRDRLVSSCVELLISSGAQRQNPAEWLWQVRSILGAAGSGAAKMTEAFRASGNTGLLVYLESRGTSK